MDQLPEEVIRQIMVKLSSTRLPIFSVINKQTYAIYNSNYFWQLKIADWLPHIYPDWIKLEQTTSDYKYIKACTIPNLTVILTSRKNFHMWEGNGLNQYLSNMVDIIIHGNSIIAVTDKGNLWSFCYCDRIHRHKFKKYAIDGKINKIYPGFTGMFLAITKIGEIIGIKAEHNYIILYSGNYGKASQIIITETNERKIHFITEDNENYLLDPQTNQIISFTGVQ